MSSKPSGRSSPCGTSSIRPSRRAYLQRDLKLVEDSYGDDVLNLVVARGYLAKLLKNPNVARYLERHQADIARELQNLIETIGQEHTGAA
jgi:RepB plasmid partitioning protein